MGIDATARAGSSDSFEREAVEVTQHLRASFLHLIGVLPNPPRRAADLTRTLGVNRRLAWQIHRMATASNPLEAGLDAPGRAAIEQVLRAARKAGASAEAIDRAARAMDAFESLVSRHADDRSAMEMMLRSLCDENRAAVDVALRRQLYRLHGQAWGVQVKAALSSTIYRPGSAPHMLDAISLLGLRRITRLRRNAPFKLLAQRMASDGTVIAPESLEAAAEAVSGPTFLREFCTQPLPEIERRQEGEYTTIYLKDTPLGNAGAQSLYMADITRDLDWSIPPESPREARVDSMVVKPTEVLILDMLFQRGMFRQRLSPTMTIFGSLNRLGGAPAELYHPDEVLPIETEAHHLGTGLDAIQTPHVPRYPEMVVSVCSRIGLDADQLDVYRCILEYPMLSSVVSMLIPLPDEGTW